MKTPLYLDSDLKAWELYAQGLTFREVGEVLGISRARAQQRVERARRKKEHYLTVKLGCSLGISSHAAFELREFFEQTDLWAPVGFIPVHKKKKNQKEIHLKYFPGGTRITCDCGFNVTTPTAGTLMIVCQRHNNAVHAGKYRIVETAYS